MKKTLTALSVITSVYTIANSNYVSIVDGNEISYVSGGFTDRVEYTNWFFDREDYCSFDNSEVDYFAVHEHNSYSEPNTDCHKPDSVRYIMLK